MSKISREDNKKRYKTGMYPTQQDFENVFDSYVHKDDTIDPSKIVSGNENIVDIINRKAEEKHSHEIKDVDGLEKFITEMTSLLEIVRDPETGEISQSKLKTLTDGIAALRDDIDTNADNVAGHESRIQTNEAALEKVYQILGKDAKESIADLADRFTALSGNYANVYAFINKVKQFLEDADASDETINRWQEIESFLQGITDTETLTGLLEQQRTDLEGRIAEAIAAIPQGNYLKLVPDLDAYTDAPDGEIVKYTGPTTDKYTHGFDYERVAGSPSQTAKTFVLGAACFDNALTSELSGKTFTKVGEMDFDRYYDNHIVPHGTTIAEGVTVYEPDNSSKMNTVSDVDTENFWVSEEATTLSLTPEQTDTWEQYEDSDGNQIYVLQAEIIDEDNHPFWVIALGTGCAWAQGTVSEPTSATSSSWQLCPASPAIS